MTRLSNIFVTVVSGFVLTWSVAFSFLRLKALHVFYNRAVEAYNGDVVFVDEVCSDPDKVQRIGHNALMCTSSRENLKIYPFFKALGELAEETYFCGSHSCYNYVPEVRIDSMTIVGILVLVLLIVLVLFRLIRFMIPDQSTREGNIPMYQQRIPYFIDQSGFNMYNQQPWENRGDRVFQLLNSGPVYKEKNH